MGAMADRPPQQDTEMAPGPERFPATPWSAIIRAGKYEAPVRREALQRLLAGYWRPIYVYIRRKWNKTNEDAKDLAQAFVTNIIEKDFMAGADPERGRFHALLRTALENFLRNQYAEQQAQRRGGGQKVLSLDIAADEEGEIPVKDNATAEEVYRAEWIRTIFSRAIDDLRRAYAAEGKQVYMKAFERYQLASEAEVSYESVAKELGLKIWDVTNYLADARRRLRDIVSDRVREYTLSEDEYNEEMKELLGDFGGS
jgi:RNA polymerase sigma factor (sigma-70 family)